MNAKTRPGLQIYSDEWMSEVATRVCEPLRNVVRAICEEYQLGDSDDPNILAKIIERELSAECSGWEHSIHAQDPTVAAVGGYVGVYPDGVEFDVVSGYWYYHAGGTIYMPEEIVERRRVK